jgi:ZIP family zinc transporter
VISDGNKSVKQNIVYSEIRCIGDIYMSGALIVSLGLGFIFLMTVLGAGSIFVLKSIEKSIIGILILGCSVGIMLATAVFALLVPAMEAVNSSLDILMIIAGFSLGCIVLLIMDERSDSLTASSNGLMLAMTLHNIPEGMTVGLAFSLFAKNPDDLSLLFAAVTLAVGIGIQNFPESLSLAVTFKKHGISKRKSFIMAALSGAVEPVFGILAVFMIDIIEPVLPFFLAYAAGTMLHVIIEELIPDLQTTAGKHTATIGIMSGILMMLILELVQ